MSNQLFLAKRVQFCYYLTPKLIPCLMLSKKSLIKCWHIIKPTNKKILHNSKSSDIKSYLFLSQQPGPNLIHLFQIIVSCYFQLYSPLMAIFRYNNIYACTYEHIYLSICVAICVYMNVCNIMAEGFHFMPLGLVRLRTFRLSAWVT